MSDTLPALAAGIASAYGNLANVYLVYAGTEEPKQPPPGTTLVGDPEHALHNRYGAETACLYLIRPDGYIAYRDRLANPDSLRRYMQQVFDE